MTGRQVETCAHVFGEMTVSSDCCCRSETGSEEDEQQEISDAGSLFGLWKHSV